MSFSLRRVCARLSVAAGVAALLTGGVFTGAAQQTHASGGVQVFVGYADSLRPNIVNFPTPWEGSPGVIYEGCSPSSSVLSH